LPWQRSQQHLDELTITDEFFKNDYHCYRWNRIRGAYFNNFIDLDRVVDLSLKWRDQKEYLWLDGFSAKNKYVTSCFVKAAKRGNDVYKSRLKKQFSWLEELDPIYFFGDWGVKSTPMLFITLTVDSKKYTLDEAWHNIADELHNFETKLRQKYGTFVKFRVWEAHESGYPHCHVVYYFHNKWFHVFKHKNQYRIATKHKDAIKKMWRMGFFGVDIQGVQDTHGAFSEVKKYITKSIWTKKGDLTNAMICLHNKQMYWMSKCDFKKKEIKLFREGKTVDEVSKVLSKELLKWCKKDFIGSIWGEQVYFWFYSERGEVAEPQTTALVRECLHNCNIEMPEIVKWKFVGCVLYDDLYKFMPEINDDWRIIADPPPDLEGYLGIIHRDLNLNLEKNGKY